MLYDFMLHPFKGKGHCVVIDSAYMGDAMCQVGQEVWGINMVGTCQTGCTGAGALGKADIKEKEILIGSHTLFGVITTSSRPFLISILLLL